MPKSPLTLSFHRTFAALAAAARNQPASRSLDLKTSATDRRVSL